MKLANLMPWMLAALALANAGSPADSRVVHQAVSQKEIARVIWSTDFQFTSVSSTYQFPNGVLLVADPGSRALFRVNMLNGKVVPVGRDGSGPGEYRTPQWIHPGPRGSASLIDPSLRRFSFFNQGAEFTEAVPFPDDAAGLTGRTSANSRGEVYYVDLPSQPTNRSVVLRRFQHGESTRDSLGTLQGLELVDISADERLKSSPRRMMLYVVPHSIHDGFVAFPQGGYAIVRGQRGQVEWYDDRGKLSTQRQLPPPAQIGVTDSVLKSVRPLALRKHVPKSRLSVDVDLLVGDERKRVWLPRVRSSSAGTTEYLQLNIDGNFRRHVLPGTARLLGVRGDTLVVVQKNEDDLERVALMISPR